MQHERSSSYARIACNFSRFLPSRARFLAFSQRAFCFLAASSLRKLLGLLSSIRSTLVLCISLSQVRHRLHSNPRPDKKSSSTFLHVQPGAYRRCSSSRSAVPPPPPEGSDREHSRHAAGASRPVEQRPAATSGAACFRPDYSATQGAEQAGACGCI